MTGRHRAGRSALSIAAVIVGVVLLLAFCGGATALQGTFGGP